MKFITSLLMFCAFVLSGCMTLNGGYSYELTVVNISSDKIHALNIQSLDTDWDFYGPYSILSPYAPKTHHGPIPAPPDGRFVYRWRDGKGVEHREEIDLGKKVSRLFQGQIVFIVDGVNKLTVETYNKRGAYRLPPKPKQ
jgi:hypothetical protein